MHSLSWVRKRSCFDHREIVEMLLMIYYLFFGPIMGLLVLDYWTGKELNCFLVRNWGMQMTCAVDSCPQTEWRMAPLLLEWFLDCVSCCSTNFYMLSDQLLSHMLNSLAYVHITKITNTVANWARCSIASISYATAEESLSSLTQSKCKTKYSAMLHEIAPLNRREGGRRRKGDRQH